MFKAYFENSRKVWKCICTGTKEQCSKAIYDFLKEKKYKSYYTNVIKFDVGVERWDVGFYTEFFWLIDMNNERTPEHYEGYYDRIKN